MFLTNPDSPRKLTSKRSTFPSIQNKFRNREISLTLGGTPKFVCKLILKFQDQKNKLLAGISSTGGILPLISRAAFF